MVAESDIAEAIRKLKNLRRRIDGCGMSPHPNDWIVDCTAQNEIRELIDLYLANLQ